MTTPTRDNTIKEGKPIEAIAWGLAVALAALKSRLVQPNGIIRDAVEESLGAYEAWRASRANEPEAISKNVVRDDVSETCPSCAGRGKGFVAQQTESEWVTVPIYSDPVSGGACIKVGSLSIRKNESEFLSIGTRVLSFSHRATSINASPELVGAYLVPSSPFAAQKATGRWGFDARGDSLTAPLLVHQEESESIHSEGPVS